MLRVTLLGNLGADPELRYSPKGGNIVSFRVAINQVRTGPDGERQENTEWFRVRVAGRQAEYVQRFNKGARVLVIGRLDIGRYQSKDGETRTSFDVWADDVQGMSPATRALGPDAEAMDAESESESEAVPAMAGVSSLSGSAAPRPNGRSARAAAPAPTKSDDLEDLPF